MIEGVTFGPSRPHAELTVADILRYPIWLWALDEEGFEGQDETWTKPVTSTTDVDRTLVRHFPSIALKVVGTALYGIGDYSHSGPLVQCTAIWQDDRQVDLRKAEGLTYPVILEAIPTILGEPGVRFRLETRDIQARRID